jgi:YegS/Rv2252/BmrU family lipid kinase
MHNQSVLKLLFIINPVSGGKEKNDWEASIREYFKEKTHQTEFFLLTGTGDETSILHHLERVKPDRVIAVGGDGTIKMMAELLKDRNIPLGIVPAGSANGMAKELSIPLNVEEALRVIIEGRVQKIDAILLNNQETCIHLSDIGLNALLVKYFENSKKRGMWGYSKGVFRVLWEKQLMYVTVKTSQKTFIRRAYMVVLANAKTYGTGAIINPEGRLDDGLFEVVLIRRLNLWELLKMLITHHPFNPECVEVLSVREVELNVKKKAYFQVDGEYLGKTKVVQAKILPQAITVILPEELGN